MRTRLWQSILILIFLVVLSAALVFYLFFFSVTPNPQLQQIPKNSNGQIDSLSTTTTENSLSPLNNETEQNFPEKPESSTPVFKEHSYANSTLETNSVLLQIPFTSQAPTANWQDPRQQDSCEEASSLMVIKWVKGEKLNPQEAEVKLIAISEWEKKEYDNFRDTSAKDTMERIITGYFKYNNVEFKQNINLEIIKKELKNGNAVIAPMDGQKLKNPYYTAPGPERHMLVIRGYDAKRGEFITNDPGTRRGEGYRYDENHFFSAIRDYPTGYHEPIENIEKNMIVVKPK